MNEPLKAAVTVTEMARMVGLSRARFYQLVNEGVFPPPVYSVRTRRPIYVEDLQKVCLEVRHRNCGVMVSRSQIAKFAESFRHDVEHRTIVGEGHVLHEPGGADTGHTPDAAGIRRHVAADDLQKRGFSCSVASDQANAFARVNLQARIF